MSYAFDPELAANIALIPDLDLDDIEASREMARELAEHAPPVDESGIDVRDVTIAVDNEGGEIALRLFTPRGAARPLPVIYDMHPGGFCLGSLANGHARAVELARNVEALVVSAEYRLAPEHPYPVGLEDCYQGLKWVADNAAELEADPTRLCVHGQSAGGGLAAAVALLARDRGAPAICFQYLGIPELDDRLDTESMRVYTDTPFWNAGLARRSWTHYLGGQATPGSKDVPAYAAPARAEDLSGMPPAYIVLAQFDPLRDEGIEYARKLLRAGVPVELHLFPGTFHGAVAIASAQITQRELAEEVTVLRRALHGPLHGISA